MKMLYALIAGIALAVAASSAFAAEDTERGGIEAPTNSNAFWYAGTGGVPSN